jgi:beta-lactam-binding protein with PASTA domain
MTVVPELRGRTLENAERLLGDRKLRIAEPPNEIEGHVWAPGRVLATGPSAGEAVPEGSSVGLTIASGWTVTTHRS